jgi:predicted component of type VI protein secretion system
MATIRLSFVEGIDRKNNTNAKSRFLFAGLGGPPGNLPAHERMGSGGRLNSNPSRPLAFSMDQFDHRFFEIRLRMFALLSRD